MKIIEDGVSQDLDAGEQELIPVPFTVTASGDTMIYACPSGKRLVMRKIKAINNPQASSSPIIKVMLGETEYARGYVVSERQRKTGPVDGALIINLSTSGNVSGTAFLEEIP